MNKPPKVVNPIPNYQKIKDSQQQVKTPYKGYLNINDAYGDSADAQTCISNSEFLATTK